MAEIPGFKRCPTCRELVTVSGSGHHELCTTTLSDDGLFRFAGSTWRVKNKTTKPKPEWWRRSGAWR